MNIIPTPLPDLLLLEPQIHRDSRGSFSETYRQAWFEQHIAPVQFVQDNLSHSQRGVLRGLHYQLPHPQGKLVSAVYGRLFDVAVDLRRHSPTFGQWYGTILSAQNRRMLWIPEGFAHGFYALTRQVICHYRCTDYYHPPSQHALLWNDPDIGIRWPFAHTTPQLSPQDAAALPLHRLPCFP